MSDKRISVCDEELEVDYFKADVLSAMDYYPFGMMMPDRQWYANSDTNVYKFAFNGKELDREHGGAGNVYDYGFRIYNPALGKFFSVDPLFPSYPWYTPYQFAGNTPIAAIDLDGLEEYVVARYYVTRSNGELWLYYTEYRKVDPKNKVDLRPGYIWVVDKIKVRNGVRPKSSAEKFEGTTDKATLERAKTQFTDESGSADYQVIKKDPSDQNPLVKTIYQTIIPELSITFADDDGNTELEVKERMEEKSTPVKDQFDAIAAVLANDPTAKIEIAGYASAKPTDIDGTKDDITEDNNEELALQRASAMKAHIITYIKTNYGVDVDPNRIGTSFGGVQEGDENRKVVITTTVGQ